MTAPPLLQVEGLAKHFPVARGLLRAVDGVSFAVGRGEAFGIVGESGSGKSTLARLILRLHDATAGTVRLDGTDITRLEDVALRPLRRTMQMVFQDTRSSLNPRLRIERILAEPLITHGEPWDRAVAARLIQSVGLSEAHLDRFPHQLSGGQRQRIGIARAIALQPRLIVADEPVSALDVSIQAQILNLLKRLQRDMALTVVLIAHDISVVGYFCDRVAVMYLGVVVETGPSGQVMGSPSHPYTRALVSAVPQLDPARRRDRVMLQGDIPSPLSPPPGCRFHTRCPARIGPICDHEAPPAYALPGGGWVACHLYQGAPVAAAPSVPDPAAEDAS